MRKIALLLTLLIGGSLLSACSSLLRSDQEDRVKTAEENVEQAINPYGPIFSCFAETKPPLSIAVMRVADETGQLRPEGGGYQMPQGGELMAVTALYDAGIGATVLRDERIMNQILLERNLEDNGAITDGEKRFAVDGASGKMLLDKDGKPISVGWRLFLKGNIAGAEYGLVISISGSDAHSQSYSAEASISGFGAGHRGWEGQVQVDAVLFFIKNDVSRVAAATRYIASVGGYENTIDIFRFGAFGLDRIVTFDFGYASQDSLVTAIRALVNASVLDLIAQRWEPARKCLPQTNPLHHEAGVRVEARVSPPTPTMPAQVSTEVVPDDPKPAPKPRKQVQKSKKPVVALTPGLWNLPPRKDCDC